MVSMSKMRGEEYMEVDHFRKRPHCYNCWKRGHLVNDYKSRKQVYAVKEREAVRNRNSQSRDLQCWSSGSFGHISRNCTIYVNRAF